MWTVTLLTAAQAERSALSQQDNDALDSAILKLEAEGPTLGTPHTSSIVAAGATLRELRPRRGRSRWRAFYRRVGDTLVVASIGPEASVDRRGFDRAVRVALERLEQIERDQI